MDTAYVRKDFARDSLILLRMIAPILSRPIALVGKYSKDSSTMGMPSLGLLTGSCHVRCAGCTHYRPSHLCSQPVLLAHPKHQNRV